MNPWGSGSLSTSFAPLVNFLNSSYIFILFFWIYKFGGVDLDLCLIWLWKGSLWLTSIAGSIAYNWSQPAMKTSVKIIHARYNLFGLFLFSWFYFFFFWLIVIGIIFLDFFCSVDFSCSFFGWLVLFLWLIKVFALDCKWNWNCEIMRLP